MKLRKAKQMNKLHALKSYASLGVLLASLTLSGCAWIGPQYHKSKNEHPEHFDKISKNDLELAHQVRETTMKDAWWEEFNDPELTLLEARVAVQNLDILNSLAQMAQSRAMMMISGAERFPNLAASGTYQRMQESDDYIRRIIGRVQGYNINHGTYGPLGTDSTGKPTTASSLVPEIQRMKSDYVIPQLNTWQYGLEASYEIDLWGRVARQYAAAKALSAMSLEERRTVLIAQQAEMAQVYIKLRSNQKKLQVLKRLIDRLKEKEELARSRYGKGLNSDQIVESVKVDRSDLEAQLPSLKQDILVGMNEIALLLGEQPHALEKELSEHIEMPTPPKVAAIGLPSDLAERRPDIRLAEDNLRRTLEEVGEAQAEFYPRFTINANFGLESLSIKDMGSWAARAWNIGPAVSLPIFQGGRLYGQLNLKKAAQKSAAITYQKTVLTAWKEVSESLSAYGKTQQRYNSFTDKINAAVTNESLVESQHKTGLVNKMSLIDAQIQEDQIRLDHIQSYGDISNSLTKLYNALGGGWKVFIPDTPNHGSGESHTAFEKDKQALKKIK